jgi:Cu/Ag efflux protein CusF
MRQPKWEYVPVVVAGSCAVSSSTAILKAARLNMREQIPHPRILSDNNDVGLCQLIFNALPFGLWMLIPFGVPSAKSLPSDIGETARPQIFSIKGVVQSINRGERQLVIRHEAVSNYMGAMTMPFNVKTAGVLACLQAGDELSFQPHVLDFNGHWPLTQTRGNHRRVKLKLLARRAISCLTAAFEKAKRSQP